MAEDQSDKDSPLMAENTPQSARGLDWPTQVAGQPGNGILPPLYKDLLEAYTRQENEIRKRTMALATMAHELKTPLAIIAGYIEL